MIIYLFSVVIRKLAWIPEKFANLNKFIKIKKDDDTWEDGWEVVGIADGTRKSSAEANENSQSFKKFGSSIK
jgi:hypothetical protein